MNRGSHRERHELPNAASPRQAGQLSLAQKALRGAAWNYGGTGIVIVGQVAYTALTARMISPAGFGAYAAAQALMMLVGYFTFSTVGNAIIRHHAMDRSVVGSGLLISGAAGVCVSLFVLAAAGLWAHIWRSPDAAPLLRLFAPQILLGALAIVPMSLLRRELRYRATSVIETSSVLIGFALGAVLAWVLRNADALVLGQVAAAGAAAVMSVLATRQSLSLRFSWGHVRSLFSFSSQVSLQQLLHAVNGILPSFAVSRSLGQTSLGFYSRGSLLVFLPQTFLTQGIYKTLYPIYPRFRDDEERRRMMVDVACVATMVWPLFGALAGLGPLVVEVMLGSQWSSVATIIGPLCIYALADFAYGIFTSFIEAGGHLRLIWLIQTCWTIVLVAALGIAIVGSADMRTLVVVAAGVQVGLHVLQVVLLARANLISARGTVLAELWAAAVTVAWFTATTLTTHAMSGQALALRLTAGLIVVVALGVVTWLALPYLPAGRALARRGIRAWRPRLLAARLSPRR